MKFEIHLFLVLFRAELKRALVTQEEGGAGLLVRTMFFSPTPIPCIDPLNSFSPALALGEMTSVPNRTLCDGNGWLLNTQNVTLRNGHFYVI